ncbi:FHA domain-containing protein [Microlunatus elymi]|uniref:FHA domain-containing protein n=1 Tax=Microlunatus elymi TaxID=2596828 RepID=A0A516PUP9_9ACTN|nr:FHA domain-containing protein [Microlunatus elymi]QDP94924.1 FHA domain-containing protein [Microlunatus elymi]
MSEITLTVVKVLFLALLWLFILFVASVIRNDLFGRAVPTGPGQQLQNPERPRKSRKSKGQPRVMSITNGPNAGIQAELAGGMIMIGRGADCQLILDDDYVSTRHARVVAGENGIYIEDLGSTNGSYVNGMRITAPTTITLQDTVRIGKTVLKLET